jgi:omega-amidase
MPAPASGLELTRPLDYAGVMKILALQFDIAWEQKSSNFETVRRLLTRAAPAKDSVVVLPEMFATGFNTNAERVAEAYGGETEQFLARLALEFGVCLLAGVATLGRDGRARNKAQVFSSSGELLAFYTKMRPFAPGGESQHYVAGDRPVVFRWGDCAVAPFICYDLRFPELFRQAAASNRPEVFIVIANFPEKRISHWVKLLQARAIENQAYVVGANRIGHDPSYRYSGRSLIIDPQGEILADAGDAETWIEAELDLEALREYRKGLPFLEDLRVV